jgi:hypothetical protein
VFLPYLILFHQHSLGSTGLTPVLSCNFSLSSAR